MGLGRTQLTHRRVAHDLKYGLRNNYDRKSFRVQASTSFLCHLGSNVCPVFSQVLHLRGSLSWWTVAMGLRPYSMTLDLKFLTKTNTLAYFSRSSMSKEKD